LLQTSLAQMSIRARDVYHVATGKRRLGEFNSSPCGCKDGMKKVCLFVHGLGFDDERPPQDEYSSYWGDIQKYATCCSNVKFMYMDTVNNAWHEGKLSKQVCDAAVEFSGSKDPMNLENIALIGHSMGNLIISAGVIHNQCKIGTHSKWIALQGPIVGTMLATEAMDLCRDDPGFLDNPALVVLKSIKICPLKESARSLAFIQSNGSTPELNEKYAIATQLFQQHVSSSMCGASPLGLISRDSAKYVILDLIAPHTTDQNDGAVDFNSCRGGIDESRYSSSWRDTNFYKANINHGDGSFRNGDGLWGDARKPTKWFQCQF
jgi:hypothetical protein